MQFSLRSLLVLFVVLTPGFALLSVRIILGLAVSALLVGVYLTFLGILSRNRSVKRIGGVIAGVMTVVFLIDLSTTLMWTGEFSINLPLRVIDKSNGEPIPKVYIFLCSRDLSRELVSDNKELFANDFSALIQSTNPEGFTEHSEIYRCGGRRSGLGILQDSGRDPIQLDRYYLFLDSEDYRLIKLPLSELAGCKTWPRFGPPLPPMTIELEKEEQTGEAGGRDPPSNAF